MTIEERFDKLELKLTRARFINRMLVVLGVGVLLVLWFFASGTLTDQDKVIDEVRTKSLTLVDDSGKPWASMGGDYGRVLLFFGENGNPRTWLSTTPVMLMFDENRKPRIRLSVEEDGPSLLLYNEDGSVIWEAPQD